MKKRMLCVLLAALLAVATFTGCTPASGDKETDTAATSEATELLTEPETEPEETIMDYTKYTLDAYTKPYWEGSTVYNETVLFVGEDDKAPLLYTPSKIISVRNYGLDVEYEEGVDYVIEDGCLRLCENSAIPYFEVDKFYPDKTGTVGTNCWQMNAAGIKESGGHKLSVYGEGNTFNVYQIAVTYEHEEEWSGFVPSDKSAKFDRFLAKLQAGEEVTVLYYGDSITTGCNTSGWVGVAPRMDTWMAMFVKTLEARYPNAKINMVNTAVGGMDTRWGVDNVQANAVDKAPDLMILAFGMNDGALTAAGHATLISRIIDAMNKDCPDCDICVVSTTLPNPGLAGFCAQQSTFEPQLLKLENTYSHLAVAQMSSAHAALLEHKRFRDMTGNNVNHPNDFLARIYTQVLIRTVLGE